MDSITVTGTSSVIVAPDNGIELLEDSPVVVDSLVARWLARRSKATRKAYSSDLQHFAGWLGVPTSVDAVRLLLAAGHGGANEIVDVYIASLVQSGLSSSLTNRRLAAIRSIVSLAQIRELIDWSIDVTGERVEPYRDTRGPGLHAVQAMLRVAAAHGGMKGLRDVVLLLLLFVLGLRREEVASLDVEHFDRPGRRLSILGKGKRQRSWSTLPGPVVAALERYLDTRGAQPGEPLFLNMDRARKGRRLTAGGLYRVVRCLGERAGVPGIVSPHRIRHSAITHSLDATGGDVRRVRRFSRHSRLETVAIYDDSRRDMAGEIASLLAGALGDFSVAPGDQPEVHSADEPVNAYYRAHSVASDEVIEGSDNSSDDDREEQ
jgi:integrase/recombinase XerC